MITESRFEPLKTEDEAVFARCVGPRVVGGIYYGGPWPGTYRVLGIHYGREALSVLGWDSGWAITVQNEDGRIVSHCTPWQFNDGGHAIEEPPTTGHVYRAAYEDSHIGPPMTRDLYATAGPAREHITDLVNREEPGAVLVWLPWGEEDFIPHADEPLEAHILRRQGRTTPTGYVVAPLIVSDRYDPHADE